jgi:hypothetical protein
MEMLGQNGGVMTQSQIPSDSVQKWILNARRAISRTEAAHICLENDFQGNSY